MSYKWSPEKKWADFMTYIQWKGNNNWKIADSVHLQKEIPLVEDWVRKNLEFVNDHDVRMAFRKFFWMQERLSPHDFTRKNQCVTALMALYQREQSHGKSN